MGYCPIVKNIYDVELSIVMPCLNEIQTLEICIRKAARFLAVTRLRGDCDWRQRLDRRLAGDCAVLAGARVVDVARARLRRGSLWAVTGGARTLYSSWAIRTTATTSPPSTPFVDKLREGYDLVMGNRFLGRDRARRHALEEPLHRQSRSLDHRRACSSAASASDFHCGLRGFSRTPFCAWICARPGWSSPPRW